MRDMLQFQPFAQANVINRVFTNDIAPTDSVNTDFSQLARRLPRPTAVYGYLVETSTGGYRNLLGNPQSGP